ncbi:tRNA lysidine(34) synthetase TilS [Paracoccus sp. Z118]|uniref:tRNA lysidine(34) synthetase TilS n=1 Tax=Paracoccus sp. Z118 TaxID=2851017 RepID=UPI001C2BEDD7|nr:tRNA lysidine(34) synthetase TilS [Paracoccus sp. Z118]MBV0891320.1 tRNA lysidine(34) synthetase TilS [Paracoccus sp. Z118]
MAAEPQASVHAALDRLAADHRSLGIALSGGGDSTALMHLAHDWAEPRGITLRAATVDHGLRPESASEAEAAGDAARSLGLQHHILRWQWQGSGNLMAQAREGRLRLLADWARGHGLAAILLGHTRDDQAETVLLRLMRGAGVDGLSGMAEARIAQNALWLRPMLDVGRAELRDFLRQREAGWADDPSNDDPDYDRVRVRQAIAALGLSTQALARSAEDMRMARDALDRCARAAAQGFAADRGSLSLPRKGFDAAPPELQRRLLLAGISWVNGADYPPRREAVAHLLNEIAAGRQATLDGVIVSPDANRIRLIREPAAAHRAEPATGDPAIWDRRWRVTGLPEGATVRTLPPEHLPRFDWRGAGFSHAEAASLPAVLLPDGSWLSPVIAPAPGIQAVPFRADSGFLPAVSH